MSARLAYAAAAALAVAASLFLVWSILALGLIGVEGDPADRMYLGVIAVGLLGALVARFRPAGMARALAAMALAQAAVLVVALALGRRQSPVTSIPELAGLNAMFIALFLGSAWLFRRAGGKATGSTRRHRSPEVRE